MVVGAAGRRQLRQFERHRASCTSCCGAEREAREELRSGSLTFGLTIAIAGMSEVGRSRPAYAASVRAGTGRFMPITVLAIGALAAALSWPHSAFDEYMGPTTDDSSPGPVVVAVDSNGFDIRAEPADITAQMPAPGEYITWTSTLTSDFDRDVTVYATTRGTVSHENEAPLLELRRDGRGLVGALPLTALPPATSLGRLRPGETMEISGAVRRDIHDHIQELSGSVSVRLVASEWSDSDPPAGAAERGCRPLDERERVRPCRRGTARGAASAACRTADR